MLTYTLFFGGLAVYSLIGSVIWAYMKRRDTDVFARDFGATYWPVAIVFIAMFKVIPMLQRFGMWVTEPRPRVDIPKATAREKERA